MSVHAGRWKVYVTTGVSHNRDVDNPATVETYFRKNDSVEAHFRHSGCVNKLDGRYWIEENPREIHQMPLRSDRVTVWCTCNITNHDYRNLHFSNMEIRHYYCQFLAVCQYVPEGFFRTSSWRTRRHRYGECLV